MEQQRIDDFGKATSDPDPMHIDPAWSREHSPFGTTTAFGFLSISLITALYYDVTGYERQEILSGHGLNYGFNRLRLVSPVPVNSNIRGRFKLVNVEERGKNQYLLTLGVTIEIEGQAKPALVGEWLIMWIGN